MYATAAATRINELEATLAVERSARAAEQAAAREWVAKLTAERDLLKASHERLRLELELLRRRIFVAKAERVDTAQLELEFAATLTALDQLGGGPPVRPAAESVVRPKPKGRRDLRDLKLPVERIERFDVLFEKLVSEGKAERFGFEESSKVAWKRGGARLLVLARAKYRTVDAAGESMIETTPMAPECFPRSLAAPSLLAHVVAEKFCDGLPLHRIEDRMAREGFPLDRGTMSRWVEDAGAAAGATVIAAARAEAWSTAFCIATDATGIAVQPGIHPEGKRQACHRSHFFVQIADRDHVFFEYAPKENSTTLLEMFEGYSGYIQADAKSVYDVLFRQPDHPPDDEESDVRTEVGCWSHARRKFWPARPRGLPARPLPRPGPLAKGSLPGTRPQVLGPDPRSPRPRPAGHRDRPPRRPAAPHAARGRAGAGEPPGLISPLARSSQSRPQSAALTLRPLDGVRAADTTTRPDLGDVSRGKLVTLTNFDELFKDILNPKQLEGLRLLVTPFPQQQFNATEDRRSLKAHQGVACFDCHANGHTNASTHTVGDIRPNEHRHRIDTPSLRGVNVQRLFGSQRALKTVEDFTEFEQRAAYFDGIPGDAARKGTNVLERGSQVHFMAEFQALLDFPPAPKLDVFGRLAPARASESELRGQEVFFGKGRCAACHPAPYYTDNTMHNLRAERFFKEVTVNGRKASADGPIKTFPLRGIKDSPPFLHDDRLLTLDATVEFFSLVLDLKLNDREKKDLVAFMRAL